MNDADVKNLLAQYRASIDNIDAALVHMLAERFRCTKAVGVLKATHGLPPADPAREQNQIARLRRLADEAQLDPDFAEKFLNFIIREVIRHHEAIAASSSSETVNAASNGAENSAASSNGRQTS
ncbi:chorismate mutase [Pseudaminobacter salicylatoxidans]|uniref:chorismate mutase n=1 Tax=Pseudaminobacter salicylatoxidans TaxID=93369 RepID=UPI0003141AB2|nr:chorismate mutase [Pseudaminobacter salicylatoxidans]